jgi:hypothetical protein
MFPFPPLISIGRFYRAFDYASRTGGAALRAGDDRIATLPSGKASPGPAPAFFEADKTPSSRGAINLGGAESCTAQYYSQALK